jgi:hypothetical protein
LLCSIRRFRGKKVIIPVFLNSQAVRKKMKKVVERERNKSYYRVLHVPIWIWVFFILPGHLTFSLYTHGPDRRHAIWLAIVAAVCIWRGLRGRLPGVEPKPYITYFGVHQPNLGYRVVCYTAAWIDLLVPFTLNLMGMAGAVITGEYKVAELYRWLYYPLAALVVLATALDITPRARRSTANEGAERGWFYVAIWTVVASQLTGWAMWRLGSRMALSTEELAWARLGTTLLVAAVLLTLGFLGKLGRTERYRPMEEALATAQS